MLEEELKIRFDIAKLDNNYGDNSDAHLMKNTEWAAVAYLSHSNYGTNKEVRSNNNSLYITGCGASIPNGDEIEECEIGYGQETNYPQSTTGNITGVFDMVGPIDESVMGNYNNLSGEGVICSGDHYDTFGYTCDSGFTTMPESKYYDYYETTNPLTACNGGKCKGHASYETKGWYQDEYIELDGEYGPWVCRSGYVSDNNAIGLFYSNYSNGYYKEALRIAIG